MPKTYKFKLIHALIAAPVVLASIAGAGYAAMMMSPPPADLDLSRTKTSDNGSFIATIVPAEPITLNQIQTWTVEVALADGSAPAPEAIRIDGGMPQHGHGLPTNPQVTADLGDGRFAVEGMKFNMPGWWVVNVHVETPEGVDQATFNLTL